jgi:protein-S-isoprenylcysteine O-methyltransferase Ste14
MDSIFSVLTFALIGFSAVASFGAFISERVKHYPEKKLQILPSVTISYFLLIYMVIMVCSHSFDISIVPRVLIWALFFIQLVALYFLVSFFLPRKALKFPPSPQNKKS